MVVDLWHATCGAGLPGERLAGVALDGFVRALDGFEAVVAGVLESAHFRGHLYYADFGARLSSFLS